MGFQSTDYNSEQKEQLNQAPSELERLAKEKIKFEKALSRLEDLFLYADDAMSEKDYLFKKRDISQNIDRLNNDISSLNKSINDKDLITNTTFLLRASNFIIMKELTDRKNIDFRVFLSAVDHRLIQEFIRSVIDKIIVSDKKIYAITFKNGIMSTSF